MAEEEESKSLDFAMAELVKYGTGTLGRSRRAEVAYLIIMNYYGSKHVNNTGMHEDASTNKAVLCTFIPGIQSFGRSVAEGTKNSWERTGGALLLLTPVLKQEGESCSFRDTLEQH